MYATLCFFGGIAITFFFDCALHLIQHWLVRRKHVKTAITSNNAPADISPVSSVSDSSPCPHESSDIERPSVNCDRCSDRDEINQVETSPPCDEEDLVDSAVGHGGHLVAAIYNEHAATEDTAALIRMAIFAGIAIAFHVSFFAQPPQRNSTPFCSKMAVSKTFAGLSLELLCVLEFPRGFGNICVITEGSLRRSNDCHRNCHP